jgi:DNA (cytosine-5)-methyltransferase 1
VSQRNVKPLAIELFAGAGGLGLGFELAGFDIGLAVEQARWPAATYRLNHPGTHVIEDDVRNVDPTDALHIAGLDGRQIDAVICGLPCQGFSESNRRTRTLANPRNHLYTELIRFVTALMPRCVVVENVAGMQTMAGGHVIERIVQECESLGYAMRVFELNAADFGAPQLRRRIFIVGSRSRPIRQPAPTHGTPARPHVTVRDAIGDLPILRSGALADRRPYRRAAFSAYQRLMRRDLGRDCLLTGNCVTRNNDAVLERYRYVGPGQNWESIPPRLMGNYANRALCHTGLYYRLLWDEPSRVVGNFRKNMLIHPSQNRGISIREAARLQSFPDRYVICGPMGDQQQQVADAVPPLLARAVGIEVANSLAVAGFVEPATRQPTRPRLQRVA